MTYEDIKYETDGRLAFITLNRPEKLNALSNNLRGEMIHAMKEAEATPEVGVIILRAAGRAFSAGYDLTSRAARSDSPYVHPALAAAGLGIDASPARWSGRGTSWRRTG